MRNPIVAAVVPAVFLCSQILFTQQPGIATSKVTVFAAQGQTSAQSAANDDEMQARIMMARKEYTQAAQLYEKLARENPRNPGYLNFAGIAHMQLADLDGARRLFERATKVDKTFADGYNNLGTVWFSLKDYRKAIRQYQKALILRPNTAAYYTNLGYAYFNRNELPMAMDMFHQALMLDPGVFEATGRDGTVLQDRSVTDHGLFNFMMAKSYAQLGDAMRCALYLRRAYEEGYKEMAKARSDPAFAQVLTDPDVQTVLDQAAPLPPPEVPAEAPKG